MMSEHPHYSALPLHFLISLCRRRGHALQRRKHAQPRQGSFVRMRMFSFTCKCANTIPRAQYSHCQRRFMGDSISWANECSTNCNEHHISTPRIPASHRLMSYRCPNPRTRDFGVGGVPRDCSSHLFAQSRSRGRLRVSVPGQKFRSSVDNKG